MSSPDQVLAPVPEDPPAPVPAAAPDPAPAVPPGSARGPVVRAVLLVVAPVVALLLTGVALAPGSTGVAAAVGGVLALGVLGVLLPVVVGRALDAAPARPGPARGAGDEAGATGPPARSWRRPAAPPDPAFDAVLEELEQSAAAAASAAAALRAYVDSASAGLQTPLADLQASADSLLRAAPGSVERERLAVSMAEQTRQAGRLVEDLVVVARLDASGELEDLPLAREPVDLVVLAAEEVERAAQLTPERTYETTVDGLPHDGTQELVVQADPLRVGQALANVLDNARYATGPGGRIRVDVRRQGAQALVTLWDSGQGVPPEEHEVIFVQGGAPPGASPRTAAAGVGLPIARALARAHGGDVSCLDRRGEPGGCFQLALPAGRA